MTQYYVKVATVNKFVRLLSAESFAELTGKPEDAQIDYDYSRHFLALKNVNRLATLDIDYGFTSEGPCDDEDDDSYASVDPEKLQSLPLGSGNDQKEIEAARRVIRLYLASAEPRFLTSDEAIKS